MQLLPGDEQRAAILNGLAELIAGGSFERFVASPLVEPHKRFFPDPWEASARGVRALALRLLHYAGIDELDVRVEVEDVRGTASVWFLGIEAGICTFGADPAALQDGDKVVGILCREVAAAFREWIALTGTPGTLEEAKTDLTTIYLGFGILTTNSAYRYRTEGGLVGGTILTSWSMSTATALPAPAMAYALAAQLVARGIEARRIVHLLEPNQEASFRAAYELLSADVDGLRATLGLPPPDQWPPERDAKRVAIPENARFRPGKTSSRTSNVGGNVFRVRMRAWRSEPIWPIPGMLLGMLVAKWIDGSERIGCYVGLAIGAIAGIVRAVSRGTVDTCSDPACRATIPLDASHCSSCGGRVRGVIRDPNERLNAEEALKEEEPGSPYRG
jgi:hypothetical protein